MNRIGLIWRRFSKRERGLVIATLAILVALLGRVFVFGPFLERREWVKSQLEIQPQRLEKNLRYIDRKSDIMAGLEKARAELKSLEPLLLTSDTASVSASDLQQTVQGLASRGGAQVVSTRVLSPETLGPFTRIPIQLEISGLIEQVTGLIQGVESAPKLLVINEINIRSFAIGVAPRRPDAAASQPQQNLRVSLTVSGFVRNRAAAASSKEAISGNEGSAQDSGNRVERRPRLESDQ
ncbi:MAG: type II secretion system protein GspM [Candidatus Binatia bacterium]